MRALQNGTPKAAWRKLAGMMADEQRYQGHMQPIEPRTSFQNAEGFTTGDAVVALSFRVVLSSRLISVLVTRSIWLDLLAGRWFLS